MITGNWGPDFSLLLKAAADAGLQVNWYTYYAGAVGGPTAVRQTGLADHVFEIFEGVVNSASPAAQKFETDFRAKLGVGLFYPRSVNELRMFAAAANAVKSNDDIKAIAYQLEGMKSATFDGGEGYMRKDDHQFIQDLFIGSFGPLAQRQVRRREDRLGLETDRQGRQREYVGADDLQDAASVIPDPQKPNPWAHCADSNRHDESGAINQFVPVEAATVNDVFVAGKDPVGEPVVAHLCQMFSTGLSSGDLDGRGTSVMFSGVCSFAVTCQPARSTNTTASAPGSTANPISWRCNSIASVLQNGRTRPAALPSAGQMEPKM